MISKISQELFWNCLHDSCIHESFFQWFFFLIEFSSELDLQWSIAQKVMSMI